MATSPDRWFACPVARSAHAADGRCWLRGSKSSGSQGGRVSFGLSSGRGAFQQAIWARTVSISRRRAPRRVFETMRAQIADRAAHRGSIRWVTTIGGCLTGDAPSTGWRPPASRALRPPWPAAMVRGERRTRTEHANAPTDRSQEPPFPPGCQQGESPVTWRFRSWRFIDKLAGPRRPLGYSGLIRMRSVLGTILDYAMRRGMANRNVARIADISPTALRTPSRTALTPELAGALWPVLEPQRIGPMFALTMVNRLPPGEAAGVLWDDLDLDAGTITVRHAIRQEAGRPTVVDALKTIGSYRTIAIAEPLATVLRRHRHTQVEERIAARARADPRPVFPTRPGRRSMWRTGGANCAASALPSASLPDNHELRNTAARLMADAGVSLDDISGALGRAERASDEAPEAAFPDAHTALLPSMDHGLDGCPGSVPKRWSITLGNHVADFAVIAQPRGSPDHEDESGQPNDRRSGEQPAAQQQASDGAQRRRRIPPAVTACRPPPRTAAGNTHPWRSMPTLMPLDRGDDPLLHVGQPDVGVMHRSTSHGSDEAQDSRTSTAPPSPNWASSSAAGSLVQELRSVGTGMPSSADFEGGPRTTMRSRLRGASPNSQLLRHPPSRWRRCRRLRGRPSSSRRRRFARRRWERRDSPAGRVHGDHDEPAVAVERLSSIPVDRLLERHGATQHATTRAVQRAVGWLTGVHRCP